MTLDTVKSTSIAETNVNTRGKFLFSLKVKLDRKSNIHSPHMQQLMSFPSILSYSLRTSITPFSSSVLCIGGLFEDRLLVESHRDLLRFVKISIGPQLVNVFSGILVKSLSTISLPGTSPNSVQTNKSNNCVFRKPKITIKFSVIPLNSTRSTTTVNELASLVCLCRF